MRDGPAGAAVLLATSGGCASLAPPADVAAGARCLRGHDSAQAHYLIVRPAQWSGGLMAKAHGGLTLGPPKATRADEDIKRWAITVRERHAGPGSVFSQATLAI